MEPGTVSSDIVLNRWHIAAGSVDTEHLALGSVTADRIAAHAVSADLMNVKELSAIVANLGTVTAGTITVVDASGNKAVIGGASAGLATYDSAGVLKSSLTTAGLIIRQSTSDSPGPLERVSFLDSTGQTCGMMFYNETTDRFRMWHTAGCALGDANSFFWLLTDEWAAGVNLHSTIHGYVDAFGDDTTNISDYIQAANFSKEYNSWTPTLTCSGAMTIGTITILTAKYALTGPWLHFVMAFTATLAGVASNRIYATLPVAAIDNSLEYAVGTCVQDDALVPAYWGGNWADTDKMQIARADDANWVLAVGKTWRVAGHYRWM